MDVKVEQYFVDAEKDPGEGVSVLVIGAGPAGLVNARTLIQDGFKVTIVCKVCLARRV